MTLTKKQARLGLLALALVALIAFPMMVGAQSVPNPGPIPSPEVPGGPQQDVRVIVANLIRTAMSLLGIIALVIVLYGGFVWMTAAGNEERVGKAKKILTSGIIGLIIVMSAYGIATFVIQSLVAATAG